VAPGDESLSAVDVTGAAAGWLAGWLAGWSVGRVCG
jgi:sugar/nucleoside kinase (ribokinase family)